MNHKIILFLLLTTFIFGKNIQLLSDNIKKEKQISYLDGNVLLISDKEILKADNGIYNEKTGEIELIGNVILIQNMQIARSDKVKLNINKEESFFNSFFFIEQQENVWLSCEHASSDKENIKTKNAIVSSCNPENPDWKITFSKGKLDKKSEYLSVNNAVFYIKNTPIFYLPYFGFSLNNQRRSGLLFPKIGFGSEGAFYSQPIYYAPYENLDFEITPQVKTKRGFGIKNILRFKNSKNSYGEIAFGKFWDNNSYYEKEKLKNKTHYGLEIYYKQDELISSISKDYEDGILLDFNYLNDIDYINSMDTNIENSNLITSNLNYYLQKNNHYFGINARYFIDTKKVNNNSTLQELPNLQYHYFTNYLFVKNLDFLFDASLHRYARKDGISANQLELLLPVSFHYPLFDEYLTFGFSENIYTTMVDYDKHDINNEKFFRNFHQFSLTSNLAKAYSNFYHTILAKIEYNVPSYERGEITQDFINTSVSKEQVALSAKQFFYDKNANKKFYHEIRQPYNLEKNEYKYANLENKLTYFYNKNLSFSQELEYSYKKKRFDKQFHELSWQSDKYLARVANTSFYKDDKRNNFLSFGFDAKLNYQYRVFGDIDFNLQSGDSKSWSLGLNYQKSCWDYTFVYKESNEPKLTSNGSDSTKKRGIYLTFELLPFGKVEHRFSLGEVKN